MEPKVQFLPGSLEVQEGDNPHAVHIAEVLKSALKGSAGYFGYKLTSLGRNHDEEAPTFLAVTKDHGVLLIDVIPRTIARIETTEDTELWIYSDGTKEYSRSLLMDIFEEDVRSRLKQDFSLYSRKTRDVIVPVRTVFAFLGNTEEELGKFEDEQLVGAGYKVSKDDVRTSLLKLISQTLKDHEGTESQLDKVISLIEGTHVYEDKYRVAQEENLDSIASIIRASLNKTFKQDEAQRIISMQIPNGPQRIRGLAGTGKTVVLALKAAITHKRLPNFKVLYLFNTQSLYGHITNLISTYYVSEARKAPDFESSLHIYHAWGGKSRAGLYSELCKLLQIAPLTFGEVRHHDDAIAYIYGQLLKRAGDFLEPIYDMVLIDEAQDFPKEVFEVIYKITKDPKRIVWAYDEFQSLRDTKVKGPEELFGTTNGKPNLPQTCLEGEYAGGIKKDFILPNSYRTPRPVLMTAHGIALDCMEIPKRCRF